MIIEMPLLGSHFISLCKTSVVAFELSAKFASQASSDKRCDSGNAAIRSMVSSMSWHGPFPVNDCKNSGGLGRSGLLSFCSQTGHECFGVFPWVEVNRWTAARGLCRAHGVTKKVS